jgi:hypothetical protein
MKTFFLVAFGMLAFSCSAMMDTDVGLFHQPNAYEMSEFDSQSFVIKEVFFETNEFVFAVQPVFVKIDFTPLVPVVIDKSYQFFKPQIYEDESDLLISVNYSSRNISKNLNILRDKIPRK